MENIKQRIVGALVLFGLVAVMLAILFRSGNSPDKNQATVAHANATPKVEIIFSDQAQKVLQKRQEVTQTEQRGAVSLDTAKAQLKPEIQSPPSPTVVSRQTSDIAKPKEQAIQQRREIHKEPIFALPTAIQPMTVWAIQVGSFKDRALAFKLVGRLKEQGYKAYIQKISSHRGISYNVRIGPIKQKKEAKRLQHKLASVLKLTGFILNLRSMHEISQTRSA